MSVCRIDRIEVYCFRAAIPEPVATSFGVMRDRPGVFLCLTDQDGAFGWGEVFANWPTAGAEHRARLLIEDIADLVLGYEVENASSLFHHLTAKTHIRALQCGEWGPFRQVIAGLDIAMHDLFARRAGLPLARFLNAQASQSVSCYASGIHVANGPDSIAAQYLRGHRAFKVKVGFDMVTDLAALEQCRANLPEGAQLFADANQAWRLDQAVDFMNATQDYGLGWIEEPLRADRPDTEWAKLATLSGAPIAAGENIAGFEDFEASITANSIDIFQPDIAKWGGLTGCGHVARAAMHAGKTYCPHFLGCGIGLLASAHLLAAVGGDGLLEFDVNPNPLRNAFARTGGVVTDGQLALGVDPGLGIETLPEDIDQYETLRLSKC